MQINQKTYVSGFVFVFAFIAAVTKCYQISELATQMHSPTILEFRSLKWVLQAKIKVPAGLWSFEERWE